MSDGPLNIEENGFLQQAEERYRDFERLQRAGLICREGTFYPGITYPPCTMYPPLDETTFLDGYTPPADGKFHVYLHIPFCEKVCAFCHYPVRVGASDEQKDRYLAALLGEVDIYLRRLGMDRFGARSVLLGGGTPTYLTPRQLGGFLEALGSRFDFDGSPQFNVDLEPKSMLGPVGLERLEIMRSYGVDRLTIGVNSFDDALLERMNRPHDAKEAVEAISRAKELGFYVDTEFIFGYPGQTMASWTETVETAISMETEEIQLYRLKLIPYGDRTGTITRQYRSKPDEFLSAEEAIKMKRIAHLMLDEGGYEQRLIRVFTRKDETVYSHYAEALDCTLEDLIAFGASSFSSFRDRFSLNIASFRVYETMVSEGRLPIDRGLIRSKEEQVRWALALPLRCMSVKKRAFQELTGVSVDDVFRTRIEKLKAYGLIEEDSRTLGLTDLGRFFADEVAMSFYHPQYMPFPESDYEDGELNPFRDNHL